MPNTIKVYGQTYTVRYHTRIFNERRANERLSGVVLYNFRLIFLDPDQPIHQLRETLLHEAGHIYVKVWQGKSESLQKLSHKQIEDLCDMFGEASYDLMLNNPPSK